MGLTQKLGTIPLAIFTDASNNVGIGAAASGSYKLQVTGTSNFTSTINGAGVSLSDTLNGTTANFTSSVTGNFFIASPVATSAQSGGLRLGSQVAINARNAANSADITLITTNSSDGVAIRNGALTIASTGAATFSSSVTANNFSINSNGNLSSNGFWGTLTTKGAGSFADWSLINSGGSGVMWNPTGTLNMSFGNNVGIGTSNPQTALHIIRGLGNDAIAIGETGTNTRFSLGQEAAYTGNYIDSKNIDLKLMSNLSGGSGGNIIFMTGSSGVNTERLRLTSGGNLEFTGTSTNSKIRFWNSYSGTPSCVGFEIYNASGTTMFAVNGNGGSVFSALLGTGLVYSSGGTLTSTNPSDERLKDNITDISWGLSDILKLRPVSYHWKDDKINQGVQFGFIAQEVQEVMPEAIKEFGEDVKYLGLEKDAIYATLVKAIQELNAKVSALENKA